MGKFITFEGVEGAGKTTNITMLTKLLAQKNISFLQTREPGGTATGEEIRAILLKKRTEEIYGITEMLLLFAGRLQHINEVILPGLKNNDVVLCDRFTDATYAYQGAGRGIEEKYIAQLETMIQNDLRPDLTIIFDVPAAIGLERTHSRGDTIDRIEEEEVAFFERVRKCYLARAAATPNRYIVLDASRPIEQVQQELIEIVCREF